MTGGDLHPASILKRDGNTALFEVARISRAILRAQQAVGEEDAALADELAGAVADELGRRYPNQIPSVENVQDVVINVLQESRNYRAAEAYILYRSSREQRRRHRHADGQHDQAINVKVLGRDGRVRIWMPAMLRTSLRERDVPDTVAGDVVAEVERMLAQSLQTDIDADLLLSMVDAALVICGQHRLANDQVPLRLDRMDLECRLLNHDDGLALLEGVAGDALRQWGLSSHYPKAVVEAYAQGRLWFDGLEDPLRGSQFIAAVDGGVTIHEILTQAFSIAAEAQPSWRHCSLVLPPLITGQLERDPESVAPALESLAQLATCYCYLDGHSPLLEDWPLRTKNVGIATYTDDFILQNRLQELGLPMLCGPHLMQGGYKRRMVMRLALNAQGLEDNHDQMDHLAMALVEAARVRLSLLKNNLATAGGEVRFSIFGLPPNSDSNTYLEGQIVQDGLRRNIALSRSANLSSDACQHLGRLFE